MKKTFFLLAYALFSISSAQAITITLDDFAGLNTASATNDLSINNYDPESTGVTLAFGGPASSLGRDGCSDKILE